MLYAFTGRAHRDFIIYTALVILSFANKPYSVCHFFVCKVYWLRTVYSSDLGLCINYFPLNGVYFPTAIFSFQGALAEYDSCIAGSKDFSIVFWSLCLTVQVKLTLYWWQKLPAFLRLFPHVTSVFVYICVHSISRWGIYNKIFPTLCGVLSCSCSAKLRP